MSRADLMNHGPRPLDPHRDDDRTCLLCNGPVPAGTRYDHGYGFCVPARPASRLELGRDSRREVAFGMRESLAERVLESLCKARTPLLPEALADGESRQQLGNVLRGLRRKGLVETGTVGPSRRLTHRATLKALQLTAEQRRELLTSPDERRRDLLTRARAELLAHDNIGGVRAALALLDEALRI